MKLSVSVSDVHLEVVDDYARTSGLKSRSAVIQHAISLLQHPELESDYATAWAEWESSGDRDAWESAATDGLMHAPR